jgi:hypothetical protein
MAKRLPFSISMSKYKIALSNEDNFALGCGMIAEHLQTWGKEWYLKVK